ncbi:MAG: aldehyde dehydrogenase family protein, partial [Lentisphaeria bacterium]|nr:aldehyde dehydrogenase family protein [Lentisphaeria bacterium]
ADGICHVYVDSEADLQMALDISLDSKCQYVAVCNAAEKLLLHQDIAAGFLQMALPALEARGVELRGCEKTRKLADIKPASAEDWKTEYLDYVLAIKTVASFEEAVEHINRYGSGHTEAIVSASIEHAEAFMAQVDAADVFWNCSTRFSDGFRFGLGAELGISTNKIHARGPVGLEGLCIYKWLLKGKGQIVADYAEGKKKFTHRKII